MYVLVSWFLICVGSFFQWPDLNMLNQYPQCTSYRITARMQLFPAELEMALLKFQRSRSNFNSVRGFPLYNLCCLSPRLTDFFSFLNLGFRQRSDPSYDLEYWQRPILNPHLFRWSPPGFPAPVVTHSLQPVFCLDRLFVILTSTAQRSSDSSQNRPNPPLIGGIRQASHVGDVWLHHVGPW